MSAGQIPVLRCDAEDCGVMYVGRGTERGVHHLRTRARQAGWEYRKVRMRPPRPGVNPGTSGLAWFDYCPEHAR